MAQALDPGVASDAPNPSRLPWSSLSRTFGAALNANGHVEQDLWALVPMARLPNITNGGGARIPEVDDCDRVPEIMDAFGALGALLVLQALVKPSCEASPKRPDAQSCSRARGAGVRS